LTSLSIRSILEVYYSLFEDFGISKSFKLKDFGTVGPQSIENERSMAGGRGVDSCRLRKNVATGVLAKSQS
jgi:hypothetical protein